MDIKQFNLFQETVQRAVDESRNDSGLFDMSYWLTFKKKPSDMELMRSVDHMGSLFKEIKDVNVCGTAACLAGTAMLIDGGASPLIMSGGDTLSAWCVDKETGEVSTIQDYAINALGFDLEDASVFYDITAPIDKIVKRCKRIASRHGYELEIL